MSGPNGDPDLSIEDGIIDDEEDEFSVEEYAAINSMLDQINSCLDDLEERNDSLNGKLQELLAANRQVRHDMRAQQSTPASGSTEEDSQLEDKSSPEEEEKEEEGDSEEGVGH